MTKLDAGLITSLPASDPGSAAVWGSKRINPRPQSCLCLAWSGCPSNDDDNSNTPHNWLRLTLAKPRPSLFSNHEKEISYRTAYKGYTWGCFFSKHNFKPRTPNDFHCKLCPSPSDDPHHLFYHCPIAQHLISDLEPLLTTALKEPTTLTQDTLLYNHTNTTGTTHVIISKLESLIRLSLFNVRNYSSLYHKPIPSSFLNDEKFKIKTKFKTFIQQYFPDNVRKT